MDYAGAKYKRPLTIEEARVEAELPHIRCFSCGKVTAKFQNRFNELIKEKKELFQNYFNQFYEEYLDLNMDEIEAFEAASRQANIETDLEFHEKVKAELGITRMCCFRTLMAPIVQPLGNVVDLDPEVDVGGKLEDVRRGLDRVKINSPVIPKLLEATVDKKPARAFYAI